MDTHKIVFRYILNTHRIRKDGKAPLFGRITYLGKRNQFSTGLFIEPKNWNSKQQQAHPPDLHKYTNSQLSLISQKINEAFLFLQVNNEEFNINDIYNKYSGKSISKDATLLEAYDTHNKKMKA